MAISLLTSLVQDQFAFSTHQWEMEWYLSVFVMTAMPVVSNLNVSRNIGFVKLPENEVFRF